MTAGHVSPRHRGLPLQPVSGVPLRRDDTPCPCWLCPGSAAKGQTCSEPGQLLEDEVIVGGGVYLNHSQVTVSAISAKVKDVLLHVHRGYKTNLLNHQSHIKLGSSQQTRCFGLLEDLKGIR